MYAKFAAVWNSSLVIDQVACCSIGVCRYATVAAALDEVASATVSGFLDSVFAEEAERWRGAVPIAWICLLIDARDSMRAKFGGDGAFDAECKCGGDAVGYIHAFLDRARGYQVPDNYVAFLPECQRVEML